MNDFDPQLSGLAAGASVLGRLSGPSRTPVGLGSILGQLGGAMYGAKQNALAQRDRSDSDRMLREAQVENLRAQAEARKAAEAEKAAKAQKLSAFSSILGQSESPNDPITILGAGIKSQAFGPQEITSFMGNVMQKQAQLEAKVETEKLRLEDRKISREEREASERRLREHSAKLQQDNMRLAAVLRPTDPLVEVGDKTSPTGTRMLPRGQAAGKPGKGIGGGALKITDLKNLVHPETGEHPPLGMTMEEAGRRGYKATTAAEQAVVISARGAEATLARLEELTNKVFAGSEEGLQGRGKLKAKFTTERLTQSNNDLALLEAFGKGTLAPLIRAVGEKGNLANQDIERALKLIPNTGEGAELPDTPSVAKGKIKQLKKWFKDAVGKVDAGGKAPWED